jgi:hypothetical protein
MIPSSQQIGANLVPLAQKLIRAGTCPPVTVQRLFLGILGPVSEFDKAMVVAKLKGARDRKRAVNGKCEGRKKIAELHPDIVAEARRLRPHSVKGKHKRSLREVAAELERLGYLNERRNRFSAASVQSMLALCNARS